jgi:hypothetical protein
MKNLEAIKDANIDAAAAIDNLDAAAKYLQDIAGITTGDIAGICLNEKNWIEADKRDRVQLLKTWLKTEANYPD